MYFCNNWLVIWHGVKKSEKLAFYCIFLDQIFAKILEFQKNSRAFWQKVCRIGNFLQKSQKISLLLLEFWHGDKKSEKLGFYCIFLDQIFAKKLEFQKFRALFGKKFVELANFCKNLKKFPYFCLNFGMVTKSLKNWPFIAFFLIKFLPKSLNFKNFARFLAKSL